MHAGRILKKSPVALERDLLTHTCLIAQCELLTRLADCPRLREFARNIGDMGKILHLRRSLHAALRVAMELDTPLPLTVTDATALTVAANDSSSLESLNAGAIVAHTLPWALELSLRRTGALLRPAETASLDLLAHALGADAALLWPLDGGLRAQTAYLFRDEVLERGDFDYLIYALSAVVFAPIFQETAAPAAQSVLSSSDQSSMLCAPAALLAILMLARGGVAGGGSGDAEEVGRQVGKFVTCCSRAILQLLLLLERQAKGAGGPSRHLAVLFAEKLVDECQAVAPSAKRAGFADMLAPGVSLLSSDLSSCSAATATADNDHVLLPPDLPGH